MRINRRGAATAMLTSAGGAWWACSADAVAAWSADRAPEERIRTQVCVGGGGTARSKGVTRLARSGTIEGRKGR